MRIPFGPGLAGLVAMVALLLPDGSAAKVHGDRARSCRIRGAEATICPSFRLFGEREHVLDVSGDGTTLVGLAPRGDGSGRLEAVRWIRGVPEPLSGLPPDLFESAATAVSRDGSVVAGAFFPGTGAPFHGATYRWRDGSVEILDTSLGFPFVPNDISGDGSVIIATADADGVRWRDDVGAIEFWTTEVTPGLEAWVWPHGISDDGDVIVGSPAPINRTVAYQWIGDTTTELPVAPEAQRFESYAWGISPDGSVVVGQATQPGPPRRVAGALWRDGVFEWRELPLTAASWDGVFLLGYDPLDVLRGYFFDATGALHGMTDLLLSLGVDVPTAPDRRLRVDEMSYDGHVVIGSLVDGINVGLGYYQAVVAPKLGLDIQPRDRANRVDLRRGAPIVVRVYGSAQADADDIDPDDLRFGPDRALPVDARDPRDDNRDGFLDRDFVFDPSDSGLAFGDREACLSGVAADLPFRLCSHVRAAWPHWR